MTETKKTTTPNASVGADAVQPLLKNSTNSITDSSNNCNLKTISMTELYDTVYPPRRPIVDNLLYSGTYLFVGAPKIGKSFFMAQLAYTVATGLTLWEYEVHQGTVLYLALEDDYARLQRRLSRMFGVEETDNLYFATQAKSVVGGLDEQLEEFVKAHPTVRLIIIDTLQKVREVSGECYSYASDYEIVTRLKKFSDSHGICLLVVHHTRKMEAGDIRNSRSRWRQIRPSGCALPPFTAMEPTKPKQTGFWTRKTRKTPRTSTRAAGIFWTQPFRITMRCSIRTTPLMANGSRITTKMYRSA